MPQLTIDQAMQIALQHHQAGRLQQAEQLYRQILTQVPAHARAMHQLGLIAHQVGRDDIAIDLILRAITVDPNCAEAHYDLGIALQARGQLDEAITAYRRAITARPDDPNAHICLGNALRIKGQLDEAIAAYRNAIALKPSYAEAHSNLGTALQANGQLDDAIVAFRTSISLNPDWVEGQVNLGIALQANGQLDEAVAVYCQAIKLRPNLPEAHANLGVALQAKGQVDEAIAAYRKALALRPSYAEAHSNLVLAMHYHAAYDAGKVADEHREWNRRYAEPLKKFIQSHANQPDPGRRLRIGYVSADFRDHPVGRFLLTLMANHDKNQVEVIAYSASSNADAMTKRIRTHADIWRALAGRTDADAADLIRQDGIDILVDLAGHTSDNRLLLFARKPAPVQVTYLGYPDSTGLSAIDYRLTDAFSDPPGQTELFHSEQLIRLSPCAWCFQPPENAPAIARRDGAITFGCFNNFAKVTEPMLTLWGRILRAVPESRLMLKATAMNSETTRQRIWLLFEHLGIARERLDLHGYEPAYESHLALYASTDIAFDTFPYHGTYTTCEALWMGAPVVSLAGSSHVSRVGVSLLNNIGLPELVARSEEEYVAIATELARDRSRLMDLRSTLRERMLQSPLMNAPRFTRSVEAAYREIWQRWCRTANPRGIY
jgi:predicted O-linked N-acetylglucosamine transferase (SPINDLY family)